VCVCECKRVAEKEREKVCVCVCVGERGRVMTKVIKLFLSYIMLWHNKLVRFATNLKIERGAHPTYGATNL